MPDTKAGTQDLKTQDFAAVADAMDAVNAIVPDRKMHGIGYCLGSTLMAAKAVAGGGPAP